MYSKFCEQNKSPLHPNLTFTHLHHKQLVKNAKITHLHHKCQPTCLWCGCCIAFWILNRNLFTEFTVHACNTHLKLSNRWLIEMIIPFLYIYEYMHASSSVTICYVCYVHICIVMLYIYGMQFGTMACYSTIIWLLYFTITLAVIELTLTEPAALTLTLVNRGGILSSRP